MLIIKIFIVFIFSLTIHSTSKSEKYPSLFDKYSDGQVEAKEYIKGSWVLPGLNSPCGANHEYYFSNSHKSKRIRVFYQFITKRGNDIVGRDDRVAYVPAKGRAFTGCGGTSNGYSFAYSFKAAEFE